MKKNRPDDQCQFKINEFTDDNLVFTLSEMPENIAGFEVHLVNGLVHIGSIHYSKITKKYSFHPIKDKFIYYTDHMLQSLSSVTSGANKAVRKNKDITDEAIKTLEKKNIRFKKGD